MDSYNVVVERVREKPGKGGHHQISPTTSLPSPLRADNAKIFNSDTLLASDVKKSSAGWSRLYVGQKSTKNNNNKKYKSIK